MKKLKKESKLGLHAFLLLELLEAIRHAIYRPILVLWFQLILFFLNSLTHSLNCSSEVIAGFDPLLHDVPDIFYWLKVRGDSRVGVWMYTQI